MHTKTSKVQQTKIDYRSKKARETRQHIFSHVIKCNLRFLRPEEKKLDALLPYRVGVLRRTRGGWLHLAAWSTMARQGCTRMRRSRVVSVHWNRRHPERKKQSVHGFCLRRVDSMSPVDVLRGVRISLRVLIITVSFIPVATFLPCEIIDHVSLSPTP